MKFFLDTEFSERGPIYPIQLISIGIVCEDGREFYAENYECDWIACNEWVRVNVLSHLNGPRHTLAQLAELVKWFVGNAKPEFWGYYADYDWVVFCQIFGAMINLPKGWPMYCRDIKQRADDLGDPELPKQESQAHHALNDARWDKKAFEFLESIRAS